ncbi:hypothetical protein [Butyrivibrio sp. MC2021]|uniref:hypothetical protein n=1 Tax=Butyrivibrio sp. MC2021 TaxID=1408306 RepID=UPI00047D566B|nr:hypothetical protein [Butyrivibrio sp. MC2021]
MISEQCKLLASVAVVKGLSDTNMGIYDVLEEFIKNVIIHYNFNSFSVEEMTGALNDSFGFKLPPSIIKQCIRHMDVVTRDGKDSYICEPAKISSKISLGKGQSTTVLESIDDSTKRNNQLLDKLCKYIEKCENRPLSENEQKNYKNSFCDYLMDNNWLNVKELTYFNNFILSIEDNEELKDILNDLKEGVILYEGVRYCGDLSELGSWKTNLTLVCDTEVLFSLCGYNDKASQESCAQLEEYIKEINKKGKKISFCYFPETREELNSHFKKAKDILAGKDILDPTKQAMVQILDGCSRFSDIEFKRAGIFAKLRAKDIHQIDRDFYDVSNEDNKTYNLESLDIKDKYASVWGYSPEAILNSAKILSHINILRKAESKKGFENCKYIFLTATNKTLRLSASPEFVKNGEVPLATTYDFLINHFWFKLNKGFGNGNKPRTVDMIMNARNVLFGIIQSKASDGYDQFKESIGKVSEDGTKIDASYYASISAEFRSVLRQPEDLTPENVYDAIAFLDNWDLDEAMRRKEAQDLEVIEKNGIIAEKDKELAEQKAQLQAAEEEKQKYEDTISDREKQIEMVNNEKQKLIDDAKKEKEEKDELVDRIKKLEGSEKKRKERNRKIFIGIIITAIVMCLIGFIILYGYGTYYDKAWAKVTGAILGLTDVVSMLIAVVKFIFSKRNSSQDEKYNKAA